MKKLILYTFAIFGLISSIFSIVNFYKSEKLIRKYSSNCEDVTIGMTLQEARKVIGDVNSRNQVQNKQAGEIKISNYNGKLYYTLEYPMAFAGSDNMRIGFDPATLLVTHIFCGEFT